MKKLILGLLGLVVVGAIGLVVFLWIYGASNPSAALDAAYAAERDASHLELKSVQVGGDAWPYLDSGGDGEVILLLHGFGADKDNWPRFARSFTDSYRVIAPDLPGFGDNVRHPDWSYDIASQVPRLHGFVQALDLPAFHLAGNSMGGNLSAAYTLAHPDQVKTLGLFCAAGVEEPTPSRLTTMIANGDNVLVPRNMEQWNTLMDLVFVEQPWVPGFIGDEIARRAFENADFKQKIFTEYRAKFQNLEPRLPEIQQPTLVLWGDQDGLLHVSMADVFHSRLPNSKKVIMDDMGHAPMIERPGETAEIYAEFIASAGG